MEYQAATFLIVDDDKVSVFALQRMMKRLKLVNPVVTASDGIEALKILRGSETNRPLSGPYIVILDLNMPRMNGHEFMVELRKDARLRKTVVFVSSSSNATADIDAAYSQNVAGYLVKDGTAEGFRSSLKMIDDYAELVVLPVADDA
jgi:CheY-like chemotaxis protein